MIRLSQAMAWTILVAVLALMSALPEVSSVVCCAILALSLPFFVDDLRHGKMPTTGQWMTLGAAALLALTLVPTTRGPGNYFVFLALLPLVMTVPLASLLNRLGDGLTIVPVASMALAGSGLAAAITGFDVLVRGALRGGELTMNPIHIADIAVLLGFLALAALLEGQATKRLVFLLGPVFALLATLWSGSRGPLVAFVFLSAFSAVYFFLCRIPARRRPMAVLVFLIVVGVAAAIAVSTGWAMRIRGIDQLAPLLGGTPAGEIDESTQTRVWFYEGAWKAFLQSPLYGHGGEGFVAAAAAQVPEADIGGWQHLHSDIADFATIGGLLGLLSYALYLAGPVVAGWENRGVRITSVYVGLATGSAVLIMGLTNAVFGILSLTSVFTVIAALLPCLRASSKV